MWGSVVDVEEEEVDAEAEGAIEEPLFATLVRDMRDLDDDVGGELAFFDAGSEEGRCVGGEGREVGEAEEEESAPIAERVKEEAKTVLLFLKHNPH
jgi:hypothetical protein